MQVHDVQRLHKNKTKKRIGRGGKRGTYSGRGQKGQRSRAGTGIRPEMRDTIKRIPKKRGYRFAPIKGSLACVNVGYLESLFENGNVVSPKTLMEKKIIARSGKARGVKILGNGDLSKKLIIENCSFSRVAREKIEKAGGSIKQGI